MPSTKPPTLVVLQLTGGNDILNTVVPFSNPLYYDNRTRVRIEPDAVLPIDGQYGFHPSLEAIKPFWDAGKMAIVNGIGYQNPSYSHFRSMDIWYTAEPEKMATDGWLGKVVRELDPKADNVLTAISFGRGLPRALSLAGVPVASVAELDSYGLLTSLAGVGQRESVLDVFSCMYDDGWDDQGKPKVAPVPAWQKGEVMSYMGQTGLDAQKGAEILSSIVGQYQPSVEYPKSKIADSLRAVAQVKLAALGTRVFYTQHDSFDTHANELYVHGKLLREVSEAVAAFFADLKANNADEDVIMLLWSEFGRRVKDNGAGTDHGAGGAAFLIGEPVKGGMYGEYPSLKETHLDIGNLQYNNDFRCLYSSVLEKWFQVDAQPIVGGSFEQFALV
ncbi:MAG: DUF1501 domain-containing protein [Chloroflexota bacterium]